MSRGELLRGEQPAEGRSFTDPAQHQSDFELARRLYQLLVENSLPPEPGTPVRRQEGLTAHGRAYRMFRLAQTLPEEFAAVIFCGCIREDYPMQVLMEADDRLVAAFPQAEGLYAYVSLERASGQWGNLALFRDAECRTGWSGVAAHEGAVAISSECYHYVRLHLGQFAQGQFQIQLTQYLDYDCTPPWRGHRLSDHRFSGWPTQPADRLPS